MDALTLQRLTTEKKLESFDDVMYFYYDVAVLRDGKMLLDDRTHDYPGVDKLPKAIDYLLNYDMNNALVIDDFKQDGFEREIRHTTVELDDMFDREYFIHIDRHDYSVKQMDEDEPNLWTNYTLTVGKPIRLYDKKADLLVDSHIESVVLKYVAEEDLIRLKKTADRFCQLAIEDYNKNDYEEIKMFYKEEGELD